jgi:hypothetical protein
MRRLPREVPRQDTALEHASADERCTFPPVTQHDATPENPEQSEAWPAWPIWAGPYLEALSKVPSLTRAADAAGVDRSTAWRLTQRDEAFAVAVHAAREQALDRLEEVIYAQATTGMAHRKTVTKTDKEGNVLEVTETEEIVRNPTLAMFYLKRWRPEYREAYRIEQTGAGGGPIRHEVGLVEELAAAARADLDRLSKEHETPELPAA